MTINSKNKGRAFEYVVRDKLTDTFGSQFERVPLSGALTYLKGDVYAPWLPDFPWTVEAKHHKEVEWNNVLTAKTSLLLEFWDQTTREAAVMKRNPLLIYKWDRSKLFACWNDELVKTTNYVEVKSGSRHFKMTLLDDWLLSAKEVYKKPN
jgi:hypothetical protein